MPMAAIIGHARATKITGASKVPVRRATSGAALERALTIPMPHMEDSRPILASDRGRNIMAPWTSAAMVAAMAIQAIMEPQ